MWKRILKKVISYSFNKTWTNWVIKTEIKKWELGDTHGTVCRPNQVFEKTNFNSRAHIKNTRTFLNSANWNYKPKAYITRDAVTFHSIMDITKKYSCEICNRSFSRSSNLKIHRKTKHEHVSLDFSCYLCRKNFKDQENYLRHIDNHREGLSFVLYKSAFDRAIKIFRKHFKNYFSLNDT